MSISELIRLLEEQKSAYGDISVVNDYGNPPSLEYVDLPGVGGTIMGHGARH